jgi:hypothetical protein
VESTSSYLKTLKKPAEPNTAIPAQIKAAIKINHDNMERTSLVKVKKYVIEFIIIVLLMMDVR